ncbi:MAG TPA: YfhO family protein [Bryobacteraceae bacterium]|nr:YfhO family protein [Bryobacteraceae bacterium]
MQTPAYSGRFRTALAALVTVLLAETVYMRPEILSGSSSLMGSDYEMLHRLRLYFARQWLFGPAHKLPAWNPHEVMGAPFSANLQGFPWIPTRLVLLLADPSVAYGLGVAIAAALAAVFALLYFRNIGLSRIGAAAAGWTFAAAGFFSSRVMAGHLPVLEAYSALPLLLWLCDRALTRARRFDLGVLAVACACVVVAGHPQIPAYAVGSALFYVWWRGRGAALENRLRVSAAMLLGIGLTLTAWWPMLLFIGRSTRILHLAPPDNDIVMPWSRLLALIAPGIQGWASPVDLSDQHPFTGYPNSSWFWDTASYIGLLPLIAIAGLAIRAVIHRRLPDWRWRFLAILGAAAFLGALPLATPILHLLPGTFLRSPARLLYISTFCAAAAVGAVVDVFRQLPLSRRTVHAGLAVLLALHFADLWWFGHWFIQTYPRDEAPAAFEATLDRELGDGRIGDDRDGNTPLYGELYDDAGGFDSVFLARFNRVWMALAGLPPDTNEQVFDASGLPPRALEAMGVRFVITSEERKDLTPAGESDGSHLYRVAHPAPRIQFFPVSRAEFKPESHIPEIFAAGSWDRLLLEPAAKARLPSGSTASVPASVHYSRPAPGEIRLQSSNPQPGFVYVLESFDPGWTAAVDGAPVAVLPANGFAIAIPVPPGAHDIRLIYQTPGRKTGLLLSGVSLLLLGGLIGYPARQPDGLR